MQFALSFDDVETYPRFTGYLRQYEIYYACTHASMTRKALMKQRLRLSLVLVFARKSKHVGQSNAENFIV